MSKSRLRALMIPVFIAFPEDWLGSKIVQYEDGALALSESTVGKERGGVVFEHVITATDTRESLARLFDFDAGAK
jgi:hypothetical protein